MLQSTIRHPAAAIVGAWMLLVVMAPCRADEFEDQRKLAAATTPEGLSLKLTLSKDTYQIGEAIPVSLKFTGSVFGYEIWTGSYDRSGRINDIGFVVDKPDGWVDPLKTYFGGLVSLGGLGNIAPLGEFTLDVEMNEWIRFDKPGAYRVYCNSWRVNPRQAGRAERVTIISEIVQIKIVPAEPGLAAQVLQDAKAGLAAAAPGIGGRQTRQHWIRQLRFLGTHEAVDTLLPLLADNETSVTALMGLVSAPDRRYAIEALDRWIATTNNPANPTYTRARETLARQSPVTRPANFLTTRPS